MKLYIATTSLNFDAIVSTDSISPAAFYQHRKFGISLFYDKASSANHNSILLTDAFPVFSFGKSDLDHRPMVLEIDSSNCPKQFEKVKDCKGFSVYRTDRTIYLSPLSCSFYFQGVVDKNATLSKADAIIESKYILYDKMGAILVYNGTPHFIKINQDTFKGIVDYPVPNSESLKEDILINKSKGFIVSYLIGVSQSVSPKSADLLRLTKDIKNCIYSLGTTEGKSKGAIDAIVRMAEDAEEISLQLDPKKDAAVKRVFDYIKSITADSLLKSATTEDIISFLKRANLYSHLYERLNNGRCFSITSHVQSMLLQKDDTLLDSSLKELQRYVASISQRTSISPTLTDYLSLSSNRKTIDCHDVTLNEDTRNKLEILFQLYIDFKYTSNGIRENRISYVIDAGNKFFSESTSANRRERDYINAILDNLEKAASFDINDTNSKALQALALFMRTPDSDLDKLVSMAISNSIPDARIAFGLWGLFYGYSNIPQNYFNGFIKQLSYTDQVKFVQQLYCMLFAKEPVFENELASPKKHRGHIKATNIISVGDLDENRRTPPLDTESWNNGSIDDDLPTDEEYYARKQAEHTNETRTANSIDHNSISIGVERGKQSGFEEEHDQLLRILNGITIGSQGKHIGKKLIKTIEEVYIDNGYKRDESFIAKVARIRGVGNEIVTAVRKALSLDLKTQPEPIFSGFAQESDYLLRFVSDSDISLVVKNLNIRDKDTERIIINDIEYVQTYHKNNPPDDNETCIDHLKRLLFFSDGKHLTNTLSNKQLVESLISELKIRYR